MNRLSVWLVGLVVIGSQLELVRAADPSLEAAEITPASYTETSMIPVVPEGVCCQNDNRDRRGLVGGVGFYLIQPFFKDNPAISVSSTSPTGPGGTSRTVTDRTNISHQMDVAPQLWLGYVSDSGLGGSVRWWYLRQATDQRISVPAAPPGTLALLSPASPLGSSSLKDNDGRTQHSPSPASYSFKSGRRSDSQLSDRVLGPAVRGGFARHINQHFNAYAVGDSGGGMADLRGRSLRPQLSWGRSGTGTGGSPVLGSSGLAL